MKSEGDTWAVRIGRSEFRADGFKLSLDGDNQARIWFDELLYMIKASFGRERSKASPLDQESPTVSGRVDLRGASPWPASLLQPDVMGWTAWIPGLLECRHGGAYLIIISKQNCAYVHQ